MSPEEMKKILNTAQPAILAKHKVLRLNGKKGFFILTDLTATKDPVDGYPKKQITTPLDVVFLKIRRTLLQGSQNDGLIKYSDEHDTANDVTTLYIKNNKNKDSAGKATITKVTGIASELREKYPELRTEQVVYIALNGEIHKLSVKGLSLRDRIHEGGGGGGFYEYISTNTESCTHITTITPCKGEEYYFISFEKGKPLPEKQQQQIFAMMREVEADCQKVKNEEVDRAAQPVPKIGNTQIEYPMGEITGDDSPF